MQSTKVRLAGISIAAAISMATVFGALAARGGETADTRPLEDAPIVYAGEFGLFPASQQ
jgi:hypothetical protein